jgi:hypothetical protein
MPNTLASRLPNRLPAHRPPPPNLSIRRLQKYHGAKQLRAIKSPTGGSTPSASAGPESVTRLIHSSWVASRGSTTDAHRHLCCVPFEALGL